MAEVSGTHKEKEGLDKLTHTSSTEYNGPIKNSEWTAWCLSVNECPTATKQKD